MNQSFLILYRLGPAWKPEQPVSDQPPPEHGRYLLDLYQRGQLRLAGPFSDDTGAAVVLEALDETQARALIEADPAVIDGIFAYELHSWALVLWERYRNRP